MDDERAGVADVGQVAAQLERLDERPPGGAAARDAEREHCAGPERQVARARVRGRGWSARPAHRTHDDGRVLAQTLGDGAGVGDVGVHPLRQRLHPLQQQEGVER